MAYGEYWLSIKTDGKLEAGLSRSIRKTVRDKIAELTGGTWSGLDNRSFEGTAADVGIVKEIIAEEYPEWRLTDEHDERPRLRKPGDRVGWSYVRNPNSWDTGRKLTGFVNGHRLFQVGSSYRMAEGEKWYLTTHLPHFTKRYPHVGEAARLGSSKEAMQDAAEEVLTEHLERLGGTWKEG